MTADAKLRAAAIRVAHGYEQAYLRSIGWEKLRREHPKYYDVCLADYAALEAALASEPEVPDAPKVERVYLLTDGKPAEFVVTRDHDFIYAQDEYRGRRFGLTPGVYHLCAERPIPAKMKTRREEVAERLVGIAESEARFSVTDQETFREAARLLREKP